MAAREEFDAPHESTKRFGNVPYGCNGKPRPKQGDPIRMLDGWNGDGTIKFVNVPFTMSTDCQYDHSDSDGRCGACVWKKGD